jgi:hypothetical protein
VKSLTLFRSRMFIYLNFCLNRADDFETAAFNRFLEFFPARRWLELQRKGIV